MVRIKWNFYRIHLTFFTFHPLIWSAIFWGANGEFPVSYVDALFLCFSAQTVTGLSTVNLSTVTGFQQFILFWLMVTGNYTAVSWVMVMVRRYFFPSCRLQSVVRSTLDPQALLHQEVRPCYTQEATTSAATGSCRHCPGSAALLHD